ncbi:MAG: glycosyltransferase [Clostridiales bacterium]|nr:glycosyltransferase [Clostridiales bacterium]
MASLFVSIDLAAKQIWADGAYDGLGEGAVMSKPKLPKVTIMIPTYNQESFIGEAVNSALMQTYPNLEVVVGDDASMDATASIVSKIKDNRLKLIRNKKNIGRTANYRNLLYNYATGDYVINLDGDDYYTDPSFISNAINLIGADQNIVMVVARACWQTSKGISISEVPDKDTVDGLYILKNMPNRKFHFKHMATLYKRLEALPLNFYRFNVTSSDWESLYRLSLLGKVRYLDKNIGVWRKHDHNETGIIDCKKFAENLEIWPSIFQTAKKHEMGQMQATILEYKCLAYFSSTYIAKLSLKGNRELTKFVVSLLKYFKFSLIFLLVNPIYFARVIAGFLGYYRNRAHKV